jgi:hypothetical protein
MSIPSKLREILDGGEVPADLEVVYDDRHGLWGGTRMVVSGNGRGVGRRERVGGDPEPEAFGREVTRGQLLELIRLLIETEAWEQRAPERAPVPDEGRATLLIRAGGQESAAWERTHEMARGRRLALIKDKMSEIVRSVSHRTAEEHGRRR